MASATKEPSSNETSSWSAFKRAHVRHRRRGDDLYRSDDLPEMVDFSRDEDQRIQLNTVTFPAPEEKASDDDINNNNTIFYLGPIYALEGFSGFYYAPQALSESIQLELAYHAVTEYCESPNATNIDLCPPKPSEELNRDESMWELWKSENREETQSSLSSSAISTKKIPFQQKQPSRKTKKYRTFQKLSWATMGYHYDWTARCYHDGAKSPMPALVADLASRFARSALVLESLSSSSSSSTSTPSTSESSSLSSSSSFTPSACIVNFYTTKSNMGGHRDDLELALDKPIVSMSLGLPAVFLLGGKSKEDSPVIPILVRPGDVMCMGGDCRLNFHAMARVLPPLVSLPTICHDRIPDTEHQVVSIRRDQQQQASPSSSPSSPLLLGDAKQCDPVDTSIVKEVDGNVTHKIPQVDRIALMKYLSSHRININVRQVYPDSDSHDELQ